MINEHTLGLVVLVVVFTVRELPSFRSLVLSTRSLFSLRVVPLSPFSRSFRFRYSNATFTSSVMRQRVISHPLWRISPIEGRLENDKRWWIKDDPTLSHRWSTCFWLNPKSHHWNYAFRSQGKRSVQQAKPWHRLDHPSTRMESRRTWDSTWEYLIPIHPPSLWSFAVLNPRFYTWNDSSITHTCRWVRVEDRQDPQSVPAVVGQCALPLRSSASIWLYEIYRAYNYVGCHRSHGLQLTTAICVNVHIVWLFDYISIQKALTLTFRWLMGGRSVWSVNNAQHKSRRIPSISFSEKVCG